MDYRDEDLGSSRERHEKAMETARLHLEKIQQLYEEGLKIGESNEIDLADEISDEELTDENISEDLADEESEDEELTEENISENSSDIIEEEEKEVEPILVSRGKSDRARKKKAPHIPALAMTMQVIIFFIALFGISVIGFCMPLRPAQSEIEKRTLTEFPEYSWESFVNGSYTDGISTWYADTFPFRERLISGYSRFKNLFGIKDEQLIGGPINADEIPDVPDYDDGFATNTDLEQNTDNSTPPESLTPEPTTPEQTTPEPTTPEETDPPTTPNNNETPGGNDTVPEHVGSVYIYGNQAFSLYGFSLNNSNRYAELINNAQSQLDGVANVYSIIVPLSYGIQLDSSVWKKMNWSDEEAAIRYMYSQMNEKVKKVSVFQNLLAHKNEYIYFRTDHHWTALGAYYAYECFAKAKGVTANPLSSFETMTFNDFLGTLYSQSNESTVLANNPDTITAYVPMGTNKITITQKDNSILNWRVINDVSNYKNTARYSCFIGGDQPYSEITNPNITDGSSVLLVKESYGNAFAPFLVDHYQNVYIVDYRYYNGKLANLVKEKKIKDVIFLNNLNSSGSASLLEYMADFIEK